jgi:hypothetical protein
VAISGPHLSQCSDIVRTFLKHGSNAGLTLARERKNFGGLNFPTSRPMIDTRQRASKGEITAMSMSIYNNATPISLHDRLDRREKEEKMGLGRLTGARVDDGLDKAAGLPSLSPPAPADSAKKVPEASAAQESSDFSRDFIADQPEAAISAQANQNKRSAMRLLEQQP